MRGVVFLGFCAFFAFAIYLAMTPWGTLLENNMHDPEFREGIEKRLDLKFPESAQWEKSRYNVWQEAHFECVFTLPKKDIDLLVPPKKGEWHENEQSFLHLSKTWLKGKNLDRFQTIRYNSDAEWHVSVAYENPIEADENQRVWVYISASDEYWEPSEETDNKEKFHEKIQMDDNF